MAPETFRISSPRMTLTTILMINFIKRKQAKIFPNLKYKVSKDKKFLQLCRRKRKASINDPSEVYHLDSENVLSVQDRTLKLWCLVSKWSLQASIGQCWKLKRGWYYARFFHLLMSLPSSTPSDERRKLSIMSKFSWLEQQKLDKRHGSGKSWYQELSVSRSSWNTLV